MSRYDEAARAAAEALVPTVIESVEFRKVALPLRSPFRTSFGTQHVREVLLLKVTIPGAEGWGEVVTTAAPVYSSEYTDGAAHVLEHHVLPRIGAVETVTAHGLAELLRPLRGHRMAKAALELALLDAQLRVAGESLATHLGAVRDRVPCGVSIGIPAGGIPQLEEQVRAYLEDGYLRIKLKIEPGFDVAPVTAVRETFGRDLPLQVDANSAYTLDDLAVFDALDELGLGLIEQPFGEERILDHARLAERLDTPICLDESILDAAGAIDAIELGATSIVNVKAGRVGGYLEAVRVHDACAAHDVPVWCGGMLETGIGRAANVALAALPNFQLPGDTSASTRYFAEDVTEPFVLEDGHLAVPTGPGIGREPDPRFLEQITVDVRTLTV
ncbi:MAG: o-succinylbenzoate synthase [Actinobacteria bacterium]|nr:o-succinylbenzoate synthase [Actinomycetota bacterium]